MAKKTIKISELPEESANGVRVYGATSYETQIAILSQYLHSLKGKKNRISKQRRSEILQAIHDYFEYKQSIDKDNPIWNDIDDDVILTAAESPLETNLFADFFQVPFPAPKNPKFTFIDLFAGIGGIRIAMQNSGGKCVYSSEWNTQAQRTYFINYGEMPFGDITKELTKNYIPNNFDILCAGFPCQPFSISGKQKGFEDTRGTLFYHYAIFLQQLQPKMFLFENVRGLVSHDKGRTYQTMCNVFEAAGYDIQKDVLNAWDYDNKQKTFTVTAMIGEKAQNKP